MEADCRARSLESLKTLKTLKTLKSLRTLKTLKTLKTLRTLNSLPPLTPLFRLDKPHDALFAAKVALEGAAEALADEELEGRRSVVLVDFGHQISARLEPLPGYVGQGAVEAQRVVVGDEEGQRGLVVKDVGLHLLSLGVSHIRRVADDEVGAVGVPLDDVGVEEVVLDEVHSHLVVGCVAAREGEGGRRYVNPCDLACRQLFGNCYGDAAAARAEVDDGERRRRAACVLEGLHHHLLRLGTGNEHVGAHLDAAVAENGIAYDVLDGTVPAEVGQGPMQAQQVALVDGLLVRGEQAEPVPAEEGLEKHLTESADFATPVVLIKVLMKAPEDVAYAVGLERECRGVHLRPKSAGISPQRSVSHLRISVV